MKERLLHTPDGVRDIYSSECSRKKSLEERLHKVMKAYGFDDIETPTFEYFDVFSEERGTVMSKNMYKFFDREGNTLVLRPDMTPSIARCVAKYFKDSVLPLRLCYSGNTFINMNEYQGKLKESTQIGAELVNDSSVQADAEMLALTVEALKQAGLLKFQVEVGNTAFFKALVIEAGLDEDEIAELKVLIENKNMFGIEAFLEAKEIDAQLLKLLCTLPKLFGSVEKLYEIKESTTNKDAYRALERLEKLYLLMKAYGYEKYISFDLGTVSQYEYYTGIIFHAYTYGTGEAVISGGRYDALIGQFGKDTPAIGMAIYVDRLLAALSRQKLDVYPQADKALLLYTEDMDFEALTYASRLRTQGRYVCSMSFAKGTNLLKKANEVNRETIAEILVMNDKGEVKRI